MDAIWTEIAIGLPGLLAGVFIAPAFGRISGSPGQSASSLPSIVRTAKSKYPAKLRRKQVQANRTTTGSGSDTLTAWIIGTAIVVSLYIEHRERVLIILFAIATAISAIAAISILLMSRKRVVAGNRGVYLALLALFLATGVGFLLVVLLWNPPFATEQYIKFLETGKDGGIEGLLFVAYQILGGLSYLVVAFFCISFSICLVSSVNLHVRAAGMWLWSISFRATSGAWSPVVAFITIICSLISIAMSSGFAFTMLQNLTK